jgi:hypothetical protein
VLRRLSETVWTHLEVGKSHLLPGIQLELPGRQSKNHDTVIHKLNKEQSYYRPGQALWVPGRYGSQISRQLPHEGGMVVGQSHRKPLHPRKYAKYSFLLEAE